MLQFLKLIYGLAGFFQLVQKKLAEREAEKKAKEDAIKIDEAFSKNDAAALNNTFNGVSDSKENSGKL